ncbi:unnamed protein product [Allacma fusca]|uniref:Uncharacterized protein n=1 Tax=Allacma fusca TaxID=39272 RepID=A0A8J2PRJ6_9HEXA|nr:unnamed protein product [Allacma fusca]
MNDLQKKIRSSHLQAKIIRKSRLSGTDCKALIIAKLQEKLEATKSVITVEGRNRMEMNHQRALRIRNEKLIITTDKEVVRRRDQRRLQVDREKEAEEKANIKAMEYLEDQWREEMEQEDIQDTVNNEDLQIDRSAIQENELQQYKYDDEETNANDSDNLSMEEGQML